MLGGEIEYDYDRRQILVRMGGNVWRKAAGDPREIGVNLRDREAAAAFARAAAPGGEGLEQFGFERLE